MKTPAQLKAGFGEHEYVFAGTCIEGPNHCISKKYETDERGTIHLVCGCAASNAGRSRISIVVPYIGFNDCNYERAMVLGNTQAEPLSISRKIKNWWRSI